MPMHRLHAVAAATVGIGVAFAGGCHLVGGTEDYTFGAGGTSSGPSCNADLCPGIDESCRKRTCAAEGVCGFSDEPAGTSCGEGGLCDGAGECAECVDADGCAAGLICLEGQCVPASCANGVKDAGESDLDCGGPCPGCALGFACGSGPDCKSGFCDDGLCTECKDHDDCGGPDLRWCDRALDGGTCVAKKAAGDLCEEADECLSGHCPADDGVCCDEACSETCVSCLKAKSGANNGTCALVDPTLAPDPDGECADEGAQSCGATGEGCSGNEAACIRYPEGTSCGTAGCIGSTMLGAAACDGSGICQPGAASSCSPYQCLDNGSGCRTFCTDDVHCLSTHYCALTNSCLPKKPKGGACGSHAECQDGHCVDGVCCESPCDAGCVACSAAKTGASNGTCAFVPAGQDPDAECPGFEACNGTGNCSCAFGAAKPNGACCTSGVECASGHCPAGDGVCCATACTGNCQSCKGADTGGADGTCGYVTALTDPENECPGGQLCDGGGACWSCGDSAVPAGGACPSICSGGCIHDGKTCVIDCLGNQACASSVIACPAGFDCSILCGFKGCTSSVIHCASQTTCQVSCQGTQACKSATVNCSSGTCELACGSSGSPCEGTVLACGVNACSATCSGSSLPTVSCGSACTCTGC